MMHLTYTPERQRIAIQKKGRLFEASMDFLLARGLSFPQNGRSLIVSSENADIDLIYLRDDDIPEYVSRGVADFGSRKSSLIERTPSSFFSFERT